MDNLDEFLKQIKEAQSDIESAEAIGYNERWKNEFLAVPATLINWPLLIILINKNEENEGIIGEWTTKLYSSPQLQEALGVLIELEDALIDYVNFSRLSNIKQNLSLFMKIGYLDLTIDDQGQDKYVLADIDEKDDSLRAFVESVVAAYENFR